MPSSSPVPLIAQPRLLSILLTLSLGLIGCQNDRPAPQAQPRTVLVVNAVPSTASGPEFIGEVRAKQRAELTFGQPGVVKQVLVETGDTVLRGQLLATLEVTPSQAQLSIAQAEVERQQAVLEEARRKQERLRTAREHNAASETEWTGIQAEVKAAEAALVAARAQHEGAGWNRAKSELRAPFDGMVASRQLEIGQAVGSGVPAIAIDGSGRELWTVLPTTVKLAVGQPAQLVTARGEVSSQLLRLGSRLEAGGARRAVLALPDHWRVGDTLAVRMLSTEGPPSSVLIPLRAIQSMVSAGQPASVLRLKADGQTAERVVVDLGASQGEQVEVLSGLEAGDRVIVAGGYSLAAGTAVKPIAALR